jgi:2-dehydro-3-deoxyphosphooctonate aldolase (KDO 8-P synthase)
MQDRPLVVAGPCVIESEAMTLRIAEALARAADRHRLKAVFKASFDKANRTSLASFRGPGLASGLATLGRVREATGLEVITDVHAPDQVPRAAEVVDALQIPAFLCRQTDLLTAAGAAGLPVNLKKGQFLAPTQVGPAVEKLRGAGAPEVWVTERGTCFGHGDLVVDLRGLPELATSAGLVLFDATHSTQRPGGRGSSSGGDRSFVPVLTRAAAAAGADGLYLEVHPEPDQALSDPDTQWPLERLDELLSSFVAFWQLAQEHR